MSIFRLAARRRGPQSLVPAFASALVAGLFVALTGCDGAPQPQPHAQIELTATDADTATIAPGKSTTFHVTLRNAGSSTVSLVSLQIQVDPKLADVSVQCSAVAATCPTEPNNVFTTFVYPIELPAGGSMTFDVVATAGQTASGAVANVVTAQISDGPAVAPVTSHGTIVEYRSGTYRAFASDATQAGIAIDFTALAATFTGRSDSLPFTLDPSGIEFDFSAASRFVTPTDLLVGGADFGHGVVPFVAGRRYATTLAELDGAAFNTVGLDLPAGGATSRVMQMWIAGSTLSACIDATPRATMAACPAASQRLYALSVEGGTYTGVDAADDDTLTFVVAKSDATLVYLAASASQFRIGLPMTAQAPSLTDRWRGAGTDGAWHHAGFALDNTAPDVLTVDSVMPTGAASSFSLTTHAVAGGPAGLLSGTRTSDAAPYYVIQAGPLMILAGDPTGGANGTLAILARD